MIARIVWYLRVIVLVKQGILRNFYAIYDTINYVICEIFKDTRIDLKVDKTV